VFPEIAPKSSRAVGVDAGGERQKLVVRGHVPRLPARVRD
jgi:hypothetical protein